MKLSLLLAKIADKMSRMPAETHPSGFLGGQAVLLTILDGERVRGGRDELPDAALVGLDLGAGAGAAGGGQGDTGDGGGGPGPVGAVGAAGREDGVDGVVGALGRCAAPGRSVLDVGQKVLKGFSGCDISGHSSTVSKDRLL